MDEKWYKRFMELAQTISKWSKDPSTQVGAVIVDHHKRIVSVGYNGYPQGIKDQGLENRDEKYKKIIHAEINAILFAKRELYYCTIFTYPCPPCSQCAAAIIQSGIAEVVALEPTKEQQDRWGEHFEISEKMFREAHTTITYLKR